jgi:hypothetical protein
VLLIAALGALLTAPAGADAEAAAGRLTATVRVRLRAAGAAGPLDARPGETAKLATPNSMRVSGARWDARAALVGPRRLDGRRS